MSLKSDNQILTIGFAGDTMLGRTVSETLMGLPPSQRYLFPWGNVLPYLTSTDFNIVNLEMALTHSTHIWPKKFNFKGDPLLVNALKAAHIGAVNTANNHILDFNNEGLFETLKTLDEAGIAHVGSGANASAAIKPVIISKNGITLGILGYTDNEPDWKAGLDHPGTSYVNANRFEAIQRDVKLLRPQVDIIIVSIHWGPNRREKPTPEFIAFAHAIIDAGVDIIHGHSAHLVQGIEIYKDKLIMYDTGDFIDDYITYEDSRNDLSFLFEVTLDRQGPLEVSLIPVAISDKQVNLATGSNKDFILERMRYLCAEFGTVLDQENRIKVR